MSFSDPRGQLHSALERDAEPETWLIAQWAHERDARRILSEDWPHSWTVPAPPYHPTMEWTTPMHPRSTQARRAAHRYAAQVAFYAHGVHPDLVLTDDIAPEDESIGTELHEVAESMAQRDIYYRPAPSGRLGDQAAGRAYRPGLAGATPDLIIVDEVVGADYGTRLHQLMEAFESGQAPAGSAAWRRRNGGV